MKAPDTSEHSWLGAALAVSGFVGTALSFALLLKSDPEIAVGIAAGVGWMLAIALMFITRADRRRAAKLEAEHAIRVRNLESDLLEARRQAGEWSLSASNVSQAVMTVMNAGVHQAANPPPRIAGRPPAPPPGEQE